VAKTAKLKNQERGLEKKATTPKAIIKLGHEKIIAVSSGEISPVCLRITKTPAVRNKRPRIK
jgi:hypothetical protein